MWGVVCPNYGACFAVGSQGGPNPGPLVEFWNSHVWALQQLPPSSSTDALQAISCVSRSYCLAVGSEALLWNGSAWTATGPVSNLYGISCVSATFCMGVGWTGSSVVAYTWSGSGWTVSGPLNVHDATDRLTGVSCVSARVCMAVGNYTDDVYPYLHTLAESWNGSAWQVQPSPTPGIFYTDDVSNISCKSRSMCMAAFGSLVEFWNGTAWTVQNEPFPGGNDPTVLDSVSCVAPNNCTLAGYYVPNLSVDVPLVETWNGASWSIPTVPDPVPQTNGQYNGSYLTGVRCTSSHDCVAIGNRNPGRAFTTIWQGGPWFLRY